MKLIENVLCPAYLRFLNASLVKPFYGETGYAFGICFDCSYHIKKKRLKAVSGVEQPMPFVLTVDSNVIFSAVTTPHGYSDYLLRARLLCE